MIQLDLVGNLRDLNLLSLCVRLLLAMAFGGTIGFERGIRQRAAGLRTHMLLCVGAASTMLVSQFMYSSYGVGDPARLSAQVISGIGFLGAGTIIVTRSNQIKGLTTAATLWATACMGLAVGVGFYECALVMYVILIFILLLVNVVDTKYLKVPTSTALYLEVRRDIGLGDAIRFIHEIGWNVRDVKEFPSGRPDVLAVRMDLESDQALRGDISSMALLKEQPGVVRLEM
ncbi:MAG: MgtC/SapB family protein [Clostridiales bacterium]|nr:MgtC/SapB family protein [Clostridiales bacterium]MDY4172863.1 MgtC/SapB family protein [Evtepia sp.]